MGFDARSFEALDGVAAQRVEPGGGQEGHGVELEQRTNILAGTTAVLGVATIAIGLFATDWGGGEASAQVTSNGVAFSYRGTLP